MSVVEISSWQFFLKGGALMWPILLGSIFSLAVVIQKALFLGAVRNSMDPLKTKVMDAVQKGDLKKAIALCDTTPSPLSEIFKSGLFQFGQGRGEIKDAMEGASASQVYSLEKGLFFLGAMGSSLPLLGFLGTVVSMSSTMRTVHLRSQAMNPVLFADVVSGMSAAFIPMAFALLVTIFVFLAYHYFTHAILDIVFQMERSGMELADTLTGLSGGTSVERDEA